MFRFTLRCEWPGGCSKGATYALQWIAPDQVSPLRPERFCDAHAERRLRELQGEVEHG